MFKSIKESLKRRSTNAESSSSMIPPLLQDIPVESYDTVVDNLQHASDGKTVANASGDRFALRGSWHTPSKFYKELKEFSAVKQKIDKSGWHLLLDVTMPNSDNKFVEALVIRWWDTTHTFHLPFVEIGITPFDFTFLTGISIGNGDPVPAPNPEPYKNCETTERVYFPRMDDNCLKIRSGTVTCKFVREYLLKCIDRLKAGQNVDPIVVARAFLFYTLGQLFFPNGNSTINIGWLHCLQDMDKIDKLDWGSAILGRIFCALDECCRRGQKSLNCFWEFVEFAMAEYICASTPVLRNSEMDCWPGIAKWSKDQRRPTPGAQKHNYYLTGEQLEMRSPEAIRWAPYAASVHIDTEVAIRRAYNLSKCRILLWDPENFAVWYLGDRCYRQLTGQIVIPINPPTPMSAICMEAYNDLKAQNWIQADQCIVGADETQWARYWATVSKGAILGALTRNVNTDGIGYAAAVPEHIRLPHPPKLNYSPMVYNTQTSSQSSAQHLIPLDRTADIAGGGGSIDTMNVQNESSSGQASPTVRSLEQWRDLYYEAKDFAKALQGTILQETSDREAQLAEWEAQLAVKDAENAELQAEIRRLRRRRSRTP